MLSLNPKYTLAQPAQWTSKPLRLEPLEALRAQTPLHPYSLHLETANSMPIRDKADFLGALFPKFDTLNLEPCIEGTADPGP